MTEAPIPHLLQKAANIAGENRGYTFLGDAGEVISKVSYTEVARSAACYATALSRAGVRVGDRVCLILPENSHFVYSFFGCMHGGFIPVPVAPPLNVGKLGSFLDHVRHIVEKSGSSLLITSPRIKNVVGALLGRSLKRILTIEELELDTTEAPLADIRPDGIAFLQFTSGSTAQPKGVTLTHANLSANAHCITRLGIGLTPEDVGCSWLPLFHDMGLIGFVISPIMTATPIVLMSPLAFVKRPVMWLRMISEHNGTISFGPNFAYGLSVKRIKEEELAEIDLSLWRVAGCGAEPIQLATLRSFAGRFARCGFREEAFLPSYGMAESTLAVTFSVPGRPLKFDSVDPDTLAADGVAKPAQHGSLQIVSCGLPFEEHSVRVLDQSGRQLPERHVGEVVIRGPSVMVGYYDDPHASEAAFTSHWLRTGDLGYFANGELYICGRAKEVIILSGRNYYPTDIEFSLAEVDGLRKGNVVAFGLSDVARGEEALVICAELKKDGLNQEELRKAVEARVLDAIGIRPDDVVLLPPDALPKTSSGKLQRTKAKELYVSGKLGNLSGTGEKLRLLKNLALSQWKLWRT